MPSAGELGDELRRIAAGLPLDLVAGAVALVESAQQRLTAVLIGSSQYEAIELQGLIDQALQAVQEAQQLGHTAQAAIQALADKTGTSGATGVASGGSGTGVRPNGTGQSTRPGSESTRPSPTRSWKTVAEEVGHQVFSSFSAAKRALGSRPGHELHHIVERSQVLDTRSGFSRERINTTDNLVWVPVEVHRRISADYSRKVAGTTQTLRDSLNGASWDEQYDAGRMALDDTLREAGAL